MAAYISLTEGKVLAKAGGGIVTGLRVAWDDYSLVVTIANRNIIDGIEARS